MKDDTYTVIRSSGRADVTTGKTYWQVLDGIFHEHQSAGGNWDHPNMLLRNGTLVVPSQLSSHAWAYGTAKRDAMDKAQAIVEQSHKPEWLK